VAKRIKNAFSGFRAFSNACPRELALFHRFPSLAVDIGGDGLDD